MRPCSSIQRLQLPRNSHSTCNYHYNYNKHDCDYHDNKYDCICLAYKSGQQWRF
jgi:hypothetical protein